MFSYKLLYSYFKTVGVQLGAVTVLLKYLIRISSVVIRIYASIKL